jgi:YD repeat-containing protein
MYRVAHRFSLRLVLALMICAALLPVPSFRLLVTEAAQGQSDSRRPNGSPRRERPEGLLPDLEQIKNDSQVEREAPPPIPSTLRSHKNPERPWNGRRVGDPDTTLGPLDQADDTIDKKTRRAHARRRLKLTALVMYEDQFIQNFFNLALLRSASYDETVYWNYIFRAAYNQSQTSLKLAAVELGKALFESASYVARNRDNHAYVYDLYKTFLMRDPDASGWSFWESQVPLNGRENVRRAFEEAPELITLLSTIVLSGSVGSNPASLITARAEPRNQPGNGMLSRDVNWSVPLLSLPGRNGLDLGLAFSYSSMVWTPSGPYFHFDEDNGFPSPGFRLGFPIVQRKVFNAQTSKNAFLLVTPAGRRVELRQVGATNIYEAADSSYLQLTDNTSNLLVRSTDGTQLSYVEINNEFSCTQVKDRNGNYITINHNALGRITTITDTLGRTITFNYDIYANLISITQSWNGQPSHQWVSFGWSTRNMQYGFGTEKVIGTAYAMAVPVITQVAVNDTSHFTFEYTNSLQVSLIKNYFGAIELNATTLTYETPSGDVPRLSSSSRSARNWSGYNNVPAQVTTQYSVGGDGACVRTAPDGTIYKQYYGSGWQKGLPVASEIWSGGVKQKWTTTAWTQENTSVSYEQNPRITETNVYDSSGNRRRVVLDYGPYAAWGLVYGVREFANDGVTEIRNTWTDYELSQPYLDRRIIGLVLHVHLTNVSSYQGKITYSYDDPARLHSLPTATSQHDPNYNTSLTARGNVTSVSRWDFTDINNATKKLTTYANYYTTGTPMSSTDPAGHQTSTSYTDAFSDSVNRNTFAYPTTITDADGNNSYIQYNFDMGAPTRTQSPSPAGQSQGPIHTMTYNNLGQLQRVTTTNNNAYKRFWYGADFSASYDTVNIVDDEMYSIKVTDGFGRVIGAANNHPGSMGGFRLTSTIYDLMGRTWKESNPTEVNSSWVPVGDDAAGIYYTQRTYDWQGRPLVTTNPDGSTKEVSYSGCGCAGGNVVTLTDEGTIDAGVTKRRQQRIYSDVLGRPVKTEDLNWQGGSVYRATVNTYNVRDQMTQIRQYAGAEGSGTYQDTAMTYDGYGRLKTKHVPQQSFGTTTTWDYFSDNTIQKITDARGATQNFSYNNRHLPTNISYTVPSGSGIVVPATTSFTYDAAGNRTLMTDGLGTVNYYYDQMSRITSETRHFNELTAYPGAGNYTLSYQYNLADSVTSMTMPSQWGGTLSYAYDTASRLTNLTGSGFGATTQFVTGIQYRAWGAAKYAAYGDNSILNVTYTSRLLPLRYELSNMKPTGGPATIMGSQNQYYADGMVKYTQDLQDGNFDRGYEYDHVGRIKEALSGREARGLAVLPYPDNPFRQSYTYDVWDNMKRPGYRHWSASFSDMPTYTNNRRSDATYDASGNVLLRDYERKQHAYDAAGRQRYFLQQEWGLPYYAYEANTIDITFDGDGRPGKRHTNRYTEDYEESPWNEPNDFYYVRSSVLGGTAIVEFMAVGYGSSINVYVGDQKIADRNPDSGYIQWRHVNPVTGSWLLSYPNSGGAVTFRGELDPLGTEMGTGDPYVSYTSYQDMIGLESMYEERGNPFDPSGGCGTIDGLPASCSEVSMRLRGGSLAAGYEGRERDPSQPPFDPRPPRYIPIQRPIDDYGVGLYGVWVPGDRSRREFRKQARYLFFTDPQKSEPTEIDKLIARAEKLRDESDNDCKALVELLKYAGELFEDVGAAVNALGSVVGGGTGAALVARAVAGRVTGRREAPQPRVGGFESTGFRATYRDFGSSPNQVRHAITAIQVGMMRGTDRGLASLNANETDPTGDGAADIRLNQVAVPLGGDLNSHVSAYGGYRTEFGRQRMEQLAKDVDEKICDPNVN